jgi:hypothetical protein
MSALFVGWLAPDSWGYVTQSVESHRRGICPPVLEAPPSSQFTDAIERAERQASEAGDEDIADAFADEGSSTQRRRGLGSGSLRTESDLRRLARARVV